MASFSWDLLGGVCFDHNGFTAPWEQPVLAAQHHQSAAKFLAGGAVNPLVPNRGGVVVDSGHGPPRSRGRDDQPHEKIEK